MTLSILFISIITALLVFGLCKVGAIKTKPTAFKVFGLTVFFLVVIKYIVPVLILSGIIGVLAYFVSRKTNSKPETESDNKSE